MGIYYSFFDIFNVMHFLGQINNRWNNKRLELNCRTARWAEPYNRFNLKNILSDIQSDLFINKVSKLFIYAFHRQIIFILLNIIIFIKHYKLI